MGTIVTNVNKATDTTRGTAASLLYAVGYGVVCGLVFPLMVSSVFLQEMTLSHGAGNSFGLLFFIAYGLTMAGWAIASRVVGPDRQANVNRSMVIGLTSAFVGNSLMFARQSGILPGGWAYAVAAAGTIGFGLATAELAWLNKLAHLEPQSSRRLTRLISLSYLVGCAASVFIFEADGPFELAFALATIVGCALIATLVRTPSTVPSTGEGGATPDFFKAVLYLAVFSFVFGAISQASAAPGAASIPIETLALLGIAIAGATMFGASFVRRGPTHADDIYWLLFPVVALSLVALPFIESPLMHTAATVLVFAAFYLTGINIRTTVCRIGIAAGPRGSSTPAASLALAAGTLCILAGVAVGAATLANGAAAGLAFISLVSLFVLSLHPVLGRFIDQRRGQASPQTHPAEAPRTAPATLEEKAAELARSRDMTSREAEVLVLICQGRTRTYIATELGISPNTVKGYMHSLYQKAGVTNKQELIDLVSQFS